MSRPRSRCSAVVDRGQSEVISALLVFGIVVIAVSAVGLVVVSSQQDQAGGERPSIAVEGDVGASWATVTHAGGRSIPLADLEMVIRSGGAETRYDLDGPGVTLEGDDGDGSFEGGETANGTHGYDGTVRLLLVETTDPGRILYEEEFEVPGGDTADGPTIERFDVNDTSADGDASYDVTWRATDPGNDVDGATLNLVDQKTGAVVDSESYTFAGVGDTGTQVGNLTNASGGGRVYVLNLTVTDAAGNAGTERVVDTADSEFGLRSPVVESFSVTDTTQGNTASYEATYNASDPDGDLVWVNVTLVNESSGAEVDSVTTNYGGVEVTGETTVNLSAGKGTKGETYFVNVTATDRNGRTASESVLDTADGGGGGGGGAKAPTIERFDARDQSLCGAGGKDTQYRVDWNVTDDQGDLDSVVLELLDSKGKQVASQSYTYDNASQAADTTTLSPNQNLCGDEVTVRINATDAAGNSGTDSWTDTVDGSGSN